MCLEAARVAAPTHCGPPRAQVRVHTVYEERPSEWTEWTAFGNVTVGIRGSIVVRRQDGNYSQIYEDAQVGVVYTLNVTLVAQSAGRVQVGGTTVRLQFASTHGNCVLGASLGEGDICAPRLLLRYSYHVRPFHVRPQELERSI